MKTLKFKCKLESEVILNQKAATEGPNQTLDFIPGSCFLGIVASELYPNDKDKANGDYAQRMSKAMEIFHSGKVRFGDAHPSKDGVRGLKIPASMFYPKLKKITDGEIYVHHLIPNLEDETLKKKQLKQCRSGFYTFNGDKATEVKTETNFAIKSAYDREKRRSKDEQMYGYESLQKGLELLFEVEVDNDNLAAEIKEALTNDKKRVGRSRTAQYGLVEITFVDDKETNLSTCETVAIDGKKCITVYADNRLIFMDEYGLPTFRPTEEQLGFTKDAKILWEKSQIRTFQCAPWNYQRQCFDTDRCGIEKGSVFVVDVSKCDNLPELKSRYLGSYNNEGFGKVVYNPLFLNAGEKGLSNYVFSEYGPDPKPEKKELEGTNLLDYVNAQQEKENASKNLYQEVNEWVDKNKSKFQGKEKFASQWGAIRGIAMATKEDSKIKDNVITYITHGVKSSDWDGARKQGLESFLAKCTNNNIREMLVNLAAEMAKKCKEEKL